MFKVASSTNRTRLFLWGSCQSLESEASPLGPRTLWEKISRLKQVFFWMCSRTWSLHTRHILISGELRIGKVCWRKHKKRFASKCVQESRNKRKTKFKAEKQVPRYIPFFCSWTKQKKERCFGLQNVCQQNLNPPVYALWAAKHCCQFGEGFPKSFASEKKDTNTENIHPSFKYCSGWRWWRWCSDVLLHLRVLRSFIGFLFTFLGSRHEFLQCNKLLCGQISEIVDCKVRQYTEAT